MFFVVIFVALVAVAFMPPSDPYSEVALRYQPPPKAIEFADCVRPGDAREIEVVIDFDITRHGKPQNVTIVSSDDHCFDRAAIRTAMRWRYKPEVKDGKRVAKPDMRTSITFQLGSSSDGPGAGA